jgi:hypothetical protein
MVFGQVDPLAIVTTAVAAEKLNRSRQTLRKWACENSGPLRPIKIGGRLAWRLADIENLLKHGEFR